MKKIKMLLLAATFCAAGYFGYTAYQEATMTDAERMFQANLEALTENGETVEVRIECLDSGNITCPITGKKVEKVITTTIVS